MDEILRSEEMAKVEELFKDTFDFSKNIVYFPIRHHSVACSYHLKKTIKEYKPDCILIEGPQNANKLINFMTDKDTKTPIAIYYSYSDSKKYINEEKEDYKCYYPFLDYSPELVALREAKKNNISSSFIDLPYYEILIASVNNKKEDKGNYNDDYFLSQNEFLTNLYENVELRSFDEFWEKYFEINAQFENTEDFVKSVLTYCYLSRINTNPDRLNDDGCIKREEFMTNCIKQKQKDFKKILVVAGGFHIYGLVNLSKKDINIQYHKIDEKDEGVYLMAYSMKAADALSGYASGMPFAHFYQTAWENLEKDKINIYESTILDFIIEVGKQIRKKDGIISSYDEICAFSMARQLASLRNKRHAGAYELWDCILSSFVKGEYNISTDLPIRILKKHMIGKDIGKLCDNVNVPPIVVNFEKICKTYNLKTYVTSENEITLDIFSSTRHREISEFLYQMCFLKTTFCKKIKGANLTFRKNRNVIRETWKYKWNENVISILIDNSVYGATIQQACENIVLNKLKKDISAMEGAVLLTQVFEMGINQLGDIVIDRLEQIFIKTTDFYSLAEALDYLNMLYELSDLYNINFSVKKLIEMCYQKLLMLLPNMSAIKDENLDICMKACKNLYSLIQKDDFKKYEEMLFDAIDLLLKKQDINCGLEGCILGILYGSARIKFEDIQIICNGYMSGSKEKISCVASFLKGIFYTAKDVVFIGDKFIKMIDEFIKKCSDDEFMKMLPEFRMAFSYFIPKEIDKIAEITANIYGKSKKQILNMREVNPNVYKYGESIDKYVVEILGK